MPTKFERERDAARLARLEKVSHHIKETDQRMSRETSRTLLLYTGDVEPDPDQPRRLYDEDRTALAELAASIRQVGVLSPIQVRPHPDVPGRYRIIVGERRWRACGMAGVNRIEAVVREDWDAFQVRAAQYEENEKRQDVSDMARARSLAAMREDGVGAGKRRSWEEIAERVGLQRNQVMRLVGLLQLPPPVQEMIDRRLLPGTHGFELVRLRGRVPDEEIARLAESSRAGGPGAKAGRPVKELARLVTDRLQAAFEAGGDGPARSGTGQEGTEETAADAGRASREGVPLAAGAESAAESLLASAPGDPSRQSPAEAPVAAESQRQATTEGITAAAVPPEASAPPSAPSASDGSRPRAFILELNSAWEAGDLRPTERRIIQDLLAAHPLEAAD